MRPNFLFIGPDKTGSSWLYEVLRQHPSCYVPAIKDLYFFDRYYDRGLDWYLGYFRDAPADAIAVGELSHDYLFSRPAAERILRDLPGVKLITSLRDPIERTFSHYLYMIRSGLTRLDFSAALDAFPELIENSRYAKHLQVYFELFDRRQIEVLMFDDLRNDAAAWARQVFGFLGLPLVDGIAYEREVLVASRPRSFLLAGLAKRGAWLARDLGLPGLVGRIKRSRLAGTLYAPYARSERPKPTPQEAERVRQALDGDTGRLQDLLGRDLSQWAMAPVA